MNEIRDRLASDPRAAEMLAWVARWWWAVLIVVALALIGPRRS